MSFFIWLLNPLKLIIQEQYLHLTLLELHCLHIDSFLSKEFLCFITLHFLQTFFVISNLISVLVKLYVGLGLELELGIDLESAELFRRLEKVLGRLELGLEIELELESE